MILWLDELKRKILSYNFFFNSLSSYVNFFLQKNNINCGFFLLVAKKPEKGNVQKMEYVGRRFKNKQTGF